MTDLTTAGVKPDPDPLITAGLAAVFVVRAAALHCSRRAACFSMSTSPSSLASWLQG